MAGFSRLRQRNVIALHDLGKHNNQRSASHILLRRRAPTYHLSRLYLISMRMPMYRLAVLGFPTCQRFQRLILYKSVRPTLQHLRGMNCSYLDQPKPSLKPHLRAYFENAVHVRDKRLEGLSIGVVIAVLGLSPLMLVYLPAAIPTIAIGIWLHGGIARRAGAKALLQDRSQLSDLKQMLAQRRIQIGVPVKNEYLCDDERLAHCLMNDEMLTLIEDVSLKTQGERASLLQNFLRGGN